MSENASVTKEKFPAFRTVQECVAYCEEKADGFYLTAFMLEAWIGAVISETVERYAEKKSGQRHLQTGVSWATWQSIFGHVKPEEWISILVSLGRFSQCDVPESELAARMLALGDLEDRHAQPVKFSTWIERLQGETMSFDKTVGLMRSMFERFAQWLEAVVHWDVHWMAAVAPISFGPTEEKRELANIGIMQANYAGLESHSREWWTFRHEELSKQFHGKAEWRLVGKAQSFERWGALKYPEVDELTILWWPLLTRYRWTDRDLRGLLCRVVAHPRAYPLREDKEFADYRQKALGLIKGNTRRDKSDRDGKPEGWRAALAMVPKVSE